MSIRKGDIVVRISYNKDILFKIARIIRIKERKIAILNGLIIRIEADAPIEDLEIVDKKLAKEILERSESGFANKIIKCIKEIKKHELKTEKRSVNKIINGTILHLDGDKRYSEKSAKFYKQLNLKAIVRNISERNQPMMVKKLLDKYQPDILITTGHDGMIKNGTQYNDIYNYRNSRYFIETVEEARKWEKNNKELAVFAGACQSFYEMLINAGANFASSPERIFIDFIDPLIVAHKIAVTDKNKFISITEIAPDLRDGIRGIGGVGAMGKRKITKTSL